MRRAAPTCYRLGNFPAPSAGHLLCSWQAAPVDCLLSMSLTPAMHWAQSVREKHANTNMEAAAWQKEVAATEYTPAAAGSTEATQPGSQEDAFEPAPALHTAVETAEGTAATTGQAATAAHATDAELLAIMQVGTRSAKQAAPGVRIIRMQIRSSMHATFLWRLHMRVFCRTSGPRKQRIIHLWNNCVMQGCLADPGFRRLVDRVEALWNGLDLGAAAS